MILQTKSQSLNSTYSGFYTAKDAANTRKSMSISRQNSLICRHLSTMIGQSAKSILNYLVTVISDSKVNVQLSREIIAENTGLSVRTVSSAIRILEAFKFLKVIRYKTYEAMNAPNIYSLTTKFWETLNRLNFSEKIKFAFDKALKAASSSAAKLASSNNKYGLPQKTCDNLNQFSVDNPKFSLDPPIPDF